MSADNSFAESRTPFAPGGLALAATAIVCLIAAGCATYHPPPRASFTATTQIDRPPKPADCSMPVLRSEPLTDHRRVAIVEAWGAVGQENEVLAALKSSGCEGGADALVIVEDQSQANPITAKFGLPESTQTEEDKMDLTQGQRYKKDLPPEVGQLGHPGYYLDSIAIVYANSEADSEPSSR